MNVGDLVRLASWTHIQPTLQIGYKAPKNKVMVAVIVGEDTKKTTNFGPGEAVLALEQLGFRAVDDKLLTQAQDALEAYENYPNSSFAAAELHTVLKKIITSVKDRK